MAHVLKKNSYGKSQVRLTKVIRQGERHDLIELTADIELTGEFAPSYTEGNNSSLIATDTMKNTVYALAATHPMSDIESFAKSLADYFLEKFSQVSAVEVNLRQDRWLRIGQNHPHSFVSGGQEKRTCRLARARRATKADLISGIDGLVVVKTGNSAFAGFARDAFTTLPDTQDRIMGTSVTAQWKYKIESPDFNSVHERARQKMIDSFADHKSNSVQETLYEMGCGVLDGCPEIAEIEFILPNQHRVPVNLKPFGLENKNEIFTPTDEPFGLIKGTVSRG